MTERTESVTLVAGPLAARLDELFAVRVLSVAIASPTTVAITVSVEGHFSPPGSRVTVGPTTVVWTVPALVVPAG